MKDAWGVDIKRACPAERTTLCPLYIESHRGDGMGCVDDMALPCKVQRGEMDFHREAVAIAATGRAHPGLLRALNPRPPPNSRSE